MGLYALCYPRFNGEGGKFVDDLRQEHDLMYRDVVRPHFTMRFQVRDMSLEAFTEHVIHVASRHAPIAFTCRYAMVHPDHETEDWYVFLVPDMGFGELAHLHDDLYTGTLASKLRLDLPFVPHIGVVTLKDRDACKNLAADLNRSGVEVSGSVDHVSVSSYDGKMVTDLIQVRLGR